MTLAEAVEAFLFHCRYEKNLSPKTLKAYATDLRQFSELAQRAGVAEDVGAIDRAVLREHLRGLFAALAEKSVKRKVATLKALFGFLEREDTIDVNPFRKMAVRIKETRRLPRTVPLAELRRLFHHLYRRKAACAGRDSAEYRETVRDIAVLETLFATGARVSEVCNLHAADVDLRKGAVRILGKGGRERMIQICHPEAIAALREYRDSATGEGEPYFFRNRRGRRLSEQSVRSLLRKHGRGSGIERKLTPHMLRHSVATLLLEEGADIRHIQHLLGHSSITTTQIYTEVHDDSQRRLLLQKHPRRKVGC